jgi:lipoprotein-anchoring transpeptidase ErfK/SrfK
MNDRLSRREFLKVGGLALSSLALAPYFPYPDERDLGMLARVTVKEIDLRLAPRDGAPIVGKRYRDQLVHLYAPVRPADAPEFYNTLWYRVWGGYLHSAYLQQVKIQHNQPLSEVPESGKLVEVTVPYTEALQLTPLGEWKPWRGNRLYYETTHWATGIEEGPDKQPWYQLTSELSKAEKYYVPAIHLRPISAEEIAPLSTNVPDSAKRVEVSIANQTLRAFEHDQQVYEARISSGIPNNSLPKDALPTATPTGTFKIYAKLPNKHMGSITGNPDTDGGDSFSLPGVPWTCFFKPEGGYAFHGTYWHNNFGLQMSHGCVNLKNADAKWLFRWSTPVFDAEIEDPSEWAQTGNGTRVDIA